MAAARIQGIGGKRDNFLEDDLPLEAFYIPESLNQVIGSQLLTTARLKEEPWGINSFGTLLRLAPDFCGESRLLIAPRIKKLTALEA